MFGLLVGKPALGNRENDLIRFYSSLGLPREGEVSSSWNLLQIMEAKYLGKTVKRPVEELDTFPAPKGLGQVTMTSDEVASSCPVTGQPDFYVVKIEYQPAALCIESKSLKLYLWGFSSRSLFAEKMAADIRDRVVADIQPKRCRVTTIQKARGGISIETVAEFPHPE